MPVIALGELVVDWLAVETGKSLLHARQFHRALGGNSANVAIALTRLSVPVRFVAKVGGDVHGEYLLEQLREEGVCTDSIIVEKQYPTAQCYMTTNDAGDHQYKNWPECNAATMLNAGDIDEKLFDGVKFMHATGLSLIEQPRCAALEKAFSIAAARNIPISFDGLFPTNLGRQHLDAVEKALGKAQILKLNEFELNFWAGGGAPDSVASTARHLFNRYRPLALLVTQAEQGSLIVTNEGVVQCPAMTVDCVSGVGAGDAYIAAVLHYLYKHFSDRSLERLTLSEWRTVGLVGNVAGALATRAMDAYSGSPVVSELELGLKKILPRQSSGMF